jgi:hypothetical protein
MLRSFSVYQSLGGIRDNSAKEKRKATSDSPKLTVNAIRLSCRSRQTARGSAMTFEQFIATVEEWRSRLTPALVCEATENILRMGIVDLPTGTTAAQVLAIVSSGAPIAPAPAPSTAAADAAPAVAASTSPIVERASISPPAAATATDTAPDLPASLRRRGGYPRGRAAEAHAKARALVREQLADGPRPASQIEAAAEAAEIPTRSLIAAADALGVRTQRGQWWLPE